MSLLRRDVPATRTAFGAVAAHKGTVADDTLVGIAQIFKACHTLFRTVAVQFVVIALHQYHEVRGVVVQLIPVDVVNVFFWRQRTPEVRFHDLPVCQARAAVACGAALPVAAFRRRDRAASKGSAGNLKTTHGAIDGRLRATQVGRDVVGGQAAGVHRCQPCMVAEKAAGRGTVLCSDPMTLHCGNDGALRTADTVGDLLHGRGRVLLPEPISVVEWWIVLGHPVSLTHQRS